MNHFVFWGRGSGSRKPESQYEEAFHCLPAEFPHTTSKQFSASGGKTTCCPGVYAADECAKSRKIMLVFPRPAPKLEDFPQVLSHIGSFPFFGETSEQVECLGKCFHFGC